jgi:hypothetical protein
MQHLQYKLTDLLGYAFPPREAWDVSSILIPLMPLTTAAKSSAFATIVNNAAIKWSNKREGGSGNEDGR